MAGITFVDTVLVAETQVSAQHLTVLLFHECVHVVQYASLGLEAFADRYVRGWAANRCDPAAIPLEVDAHELERRFEADPVRGFSVEAEVAHRLGA
jgi:hypothetical protein